MTTRQDKAAEIDKKLKEANLLISELMSDHPDFHVTAKLEEMPRGFIDKWHQHPWHQIAFPFEGILQTKVADSQFVIPHSGMLFIPANTRHESFVMTDTKFIGIYLNPKFTNDYPLKTKAISVTPFLRELILHISQCVANLEVSEQEISNLLAVLIDQISAGESYQMRLLLPSDRRLMIIFNALIADPKLKVKLSDWAKQVGASERTLSRLFTKELGMTFPLWRRHLRLVSSLNLLETTLSVQEIAFNVGYNTDSSFIYAFKKLFNQTPQQYRNSGFKLSSRVSSSINVM
jgi:AraC-like DNA-binding protein/quercetin dioxygenase-like cupin family protein